MKQLTYFEGIWTAVEYLVLVRDEPSFAAEIMSMANMRAKDALKILRRTKYETKKLRTFLREEKII